MLHNRLHKWLASVIVFENDVLAQIGTDKGTSDKHAKAEVSGSIVILAEDNQDIDVIASTGNVSGQVAAAAGTCVITLEGKVRAQAGKYAELNAYGNYAVLFYTGEGGKKKNLYRGLLIGAYNVSDINQKVFCASGSGAVAAAGAVATVIAKNETRAGILSNARINQGSRESHHQEQTVRVVAVSESSVDTADGGAAGSIYAGIGAAAVVIVQEKQTAAEISSDAKINAKGNIDVIALTVNNIKILSAAMGGALVGVSGSAAVLSITDYTAAVVGANAKLNAGLDINIKANSQNGFELKAGSISAGAGAIGGAAVSLTIKAVTLAAVGDGAEISGRNVYIISESKEDIDAQAAGAAASAGLSASGSVVVLIMNVTTQALAGNGVKITAVNELKISAKDTSIINGLAGGAALAIGIGAGGAVDVILYRNTVTAGIGNGCTVTAGFINILAQADRNVTAKSLMVSAGIGAVSGSVIVISVGAPQMTKTQIKPLRTIK